MIRENHSFNYKDIKSSIIMSWIIFLSKKTSFRFTDLYAYMYISFLCMVYNELVLSVSHINKKLINYYKLV